MSEDNLYKEGDELPEGKKVGDLKTREGIEYSTEKLNRRKNDSPPEE
jgi:hypothetical protein